MSRQQEAFEHALSRNVFTDNAGDFNYQGNYKYAGVVELEGRSYYVFQHVFHHRNIVRLERERAVA
jgi:hypothetical protein